MIEMFGVSRVFGGAAPVRALNGVTFDVGEGELVTIMGPSGSGKSTLLHILGLLDRPTAGSYLLSGRLVKAMDERTLSAVRGAWIGFVFQAFHLLAYRSALENVALAGIYNGLPARTRSSAAARALVRVGLGHRLSALPATLSGGEKQRVAIARALAPGPRLLLCDEPTGALDQTTGKGVMDLFQSLCDGGLTVVVITHDPMVAAYGQASYRLVDGEISRAR